MILQVSESTTTVKEQQFTLPGYYTWEQFEAIESLIADAPGLRITYLDGCVEFMTLGEDHEQIKSVLGIFIALYLFEKGIKFIPVGSATRRDKSKDVSFEPDESYYLGEKKDHPDLAIEVTITSGGIDKLEKYKRLKIAEVWFWENNQLVLYRLREHNYAQISKSEFLPDLDIALLVRCVQMSDILAARTEFINGMRQIG
ncbi:Uma2 family endonuclease [Coleofasciculus sp. FACHB-64]|uniref:Uma2 family endonuclease n=1 Tax=Cyanophyceae TaxID=3028117 RepID=UPI001688FF14|nr:MULTISPECIES: Uma2 family endonuclease [unclassified Coleofasciculus]MBD1837833.1 Uma2 family endonuclease [Coleofasciculus sp. FACHB-501]MBD2044408.1 Uma2 family endonuclease [Coleofasciculus sp. FACHB-64]